MAVQLPVKHFGDVHFSTTRFLVGVDRRQYTVMGGYGRWVFYGWFSTRDTVVRRNQQDEKDRTELDRFGDRAAEGSVFGTFLPMPDVLRSRKRLFVGRRGEERTYPPPCQTEKRSEYSAQCKRQIGLGKQDRNQEPSA